MPGILFLFRFIQPLTLIGGGWREAGGKRNYEEERRKRRLIDRSRDARSSKFSAFLHVPQHLCNRLPESPLASRRGVCPSFTLTCTTDRTEARKTARMLLPSFALFPFPSNPRFPRSPSLSLCRSCLVLVPAAAASYSSSGVQTPLAEQVKSRAEA